MDRKHMAVLLTVLWLVAASVAGFSVRPAEAVELSAFPPDVQAKLVTALNLLPPIQRQMQLNAIAQLSPAMVAVYTSLIRGITTQQLFVAMAISWGGGVGMGGGLPPGVVMRDGIPPEQYLQDTRDIRCKLLPSEQRSACQGP